MITLDVESMYTNINNVDGIAAVDEVFADEINKPRSRYPYIKRLLEKTLTNNDFEFNGSHYLQKSGVSMGIKFAPSFADIFMAKWENDALSKYPHSPLFYGRFLDDIFMIWTHGIEKFEEFLEILNSHHPTIKLKATISDTEVNFLDTTVYKPYSKSTRLHTKVYFKPTDTHALLHKKSYHPKSTFRGIVKSQILRFRSICSTKEDFEHAWRTLSKALGSRNYSKRWLRHIKKEVLSERESNDRAGLAISMPGSSKNGYIQCKSTHSCTTCVSSKTLDNFYSEVTEYNYPVKGRISCKTTNVIYLITCEVCGDQYVGQTRRELNTRFKEHRNALLDTLKLEKDRTYVPTAISIHFEECHPLQILDRDAPPITVVGIELVPDQGSETENIQKLLEREHFWIDTLVTFKPQGMNDDRWNWIEKDKRKNTSVIPFIVPFSSTGKAAGDIAKKYYKKIQEIHEIYEDIFYHIPIIAYRKHANLQDLLVSTKLS